MQATIEVKEWTLGGWYLRFSAPSSDFAAVVAAIKALPKTVRRWNPAALGGRGAWFNSGWAWEQVWHLFANDMPQLPAAVAEAYWVLNIAPTATLADVKAAYHRALRAD
jgi:hypothetical protein